MTEKKFLNENIVPDYPTLRTIDSAGSIKLTLKKDKITIVTQEFHNCALFISQFPSVDSVGFEGEDALWSKAIKTELMQCLARTKAIIDFFISKKA